MSASMSLDKAVGKIQIESANTENARYYGWKAVAFLVLAAVVFGGIAIFNKRPLILEPSSPDFNPIVLMPVIIAIGGVFYLPRAGLDWLRARRFGTSVLELDEVFAGQRMHGMLRTTRDLNPRSDFVLRLQCIRGKEIAVPGQTRGYTSSTTVDEVLCELIQKVNGQRSRSSVGIPVDFTLPGEMPPTHGIQGIAGSVRWALIAEARLAGLNYNAVFRIPVAAASRRRARTVTS
jgi:hypothetical protein